MLEETNIRLLSGVSECFREWHNDISEFNKELLISDDPHPIGR